jgi:dTDP-4-dehydrorhamnose reductase
MGKILILGAKGTLGGQLIKVFGEGCIGWDRSDLDVINVKELKLKIEDLKPVAVINCVAFNDVDGSEGKKDFAFLFNSELPKNLAVICRRINAALVHFSTNYVFDGQLGEYNEDSKPNPMSVYGQSKYQGEAEIQKHGGLFHIIRTSVIFGVKGESEFSKKSFIDIMLDLAEKTDTIKAVDDEINSLTYSNDLAKGVKDLLMSNHPSGIYHIINSGQASWYELAKEIFTISGKDINLIPVPSSEFPRKAKRPKKSVLINTKLYPLRPWQESLREFLKPLT